MRRRPPLAGDPGDGALDLGPVLGVVRAQVRVAGPLPARGAQPGIVFVQDQGATTDAAGAPGPQWASAAGGAEHHAAFRADRAGDVVGAGDRARDLVDGEVVEGETGLDCRVNGLGLSTAMYSVNYSAARSSPVP